MIESTTTVYVNAPDLPRTVTLSSPLAREVIGIEPGFFCDVHDRFGGHTVRKVRPVPAPSLFDRVHAVAKGRVAHL